MKNFLGHAVKSKDAPLFLATVLYNGSIAVMFSPHLKFSIFLVLVISLIASDTHGQQAAVIVNTNVTIRAMASNLSSGNSQRYETPGLNILKGLKPDVVAMQEFNVSNSFGINTAAAIRSMIDNTFGTNFVYFRESSTTETYDIPNGIISRYPIISSGSWDDTLIPNRGFAWSQIDIPGTNNLFVVSIHLKASSADSATRASEASNLRTLIQSNFPSNALVIVAGDCNTYSSGEGALVTFRTFLNDSPAPADNLGGTNTNAGRSERYDYVFPSFSLNSNRVATVIGSHTFTNGLVFDSRVYSPLSEVAPVVSTDSGVTGMQHMGVVKDFRINYTTTNFVTVPPPTLVLNSTNIIRWQGLSNVAYSVQVSTNLPSFATVGTATSTTTNLSFTNQNNGAPQSFFRVIYP